MADNTSPSKSFKSPAIHRTPLYRARSAYWGMLARCGDPKGKNPTYKNVELRITLEEWMKWAVPRYEECIKQFPEHSPNVARFEDRGHYEIGNIEILPFFKNRAQQKHKIKNPILPDGTKVCAKCNEAKLQDDFNRLARSHDGLNTVCKDCKNAHSNEYRKTYVRKFRIGGVTVARSSLKA